jgi:hypothetical protein
VLEFGDDEEFAIHTNGGAGTKFGRFHSGGSCGLLEKSKEGVCS